MQQTTPPRTETPHFASWAPGDGNFSAPILAALRAAGFSAQIGSRRVPAQNFEVQFCTHDADRVRDIIVGTDPLAIPLSVGR